MVWPQRGSRKSISAMMWAPEKCLVGAHGKARGRLDDLDVEMIRAAHLEALKINLSESLNTVERLKEWNPSLFLVVRVTMDFSGQKVDSKMFTDQVESEIGRFYRAGIRYFELHSNANLQVEGWQRSWSGGAEFATWLQNVSRRLKSLFPDISLGFPGISPGDTVSGWRANAEQFIRDAEPAVHELDWCGVNCYWTDTFGMQSFQGGRWFEFYRHRFPDKLLMITEFYNASPNVPAITKAEQALSYFRSLRNLEGLGAAFSFAISSDEGYESIVWRAKDENDTEWTDVIGGRDF
jgi:hypothetical protein